MKMLELAKYKRISKRGHQWPKFLYKVVSKWDEDRVDEVPCSSVARYFYPENVGYRSLHSPAPGAGANGPMRSPFVRDCLLANGVPSS
jgi:hypothetical protein